MASIADNGGAIQNVPGAVIFIGYVLAALCLTILIVINLYQTYVSRPSPSSEEGNRLSYQLQVFVALGILSFATLSYHMLSYLYFSYGGWAESRDIAARELHASNLHSLWLWLTESTLFYDFARTICKNSANFWWTLQALLITMASSLFISVEGEKCKFIRCISFVC